MKCLILYVSLFLLGSGALKAQTAHEYLRAADRAFENSEFEKAAGLYEGADRERSSAKAKYNKANALYQLGQYEEASKIYQESLDQVENDDLKFRNFHNLGNAYVQQKDFQKAVDAYQNALKVNPNDMGTKKNLVRALRQLPPPQKQEQQASDTEKNDKSEREKDQQQSEKDQEESQQETKASQSMAQQDLSEEEMQRLLKAAENEDQSVQKKLRKKKTDQQSPRPVKDW